MWRQLPQLHEELDDFVLLGVIVPHFYGDREQYFVKDEEVAGLPLMRLPITVESRLVNGAVQVVELSRSGSSSAVVVGKQVFLEHACDHGLELILGI
jgi:hypothetical protein